MDLVLVLLLGVFGIAVYFFPTLVASLGGKRNRGAILVLNLVSVHLPAMSTVNVRTEPSNCPSNQAS